MTGLDVFTAFNFGPRPIRALPQRTGAGGLGGRPHNHKPVRAWVTLNSPGTDGTTTGEGVS